MKNEKTSPSTLSVILEEEDRRELYKLLSRVLTIRERRVLNLRYGLFGPEYKLRSIGEMMGVCAERVRQIENRAVEKLYREYSRKEGGDR